MWHDWPESSFSDIAEVKLKELTELTKDEKKQIIDIFMKIHFSSKELSNKIHVESKFKSFVTAKNFIDLIK